MTMKAELTKAFTVYERPMLEYCSPVWSPCYIGNINILESVQRMFAKRVTGMGWLRGTVVRTLVFDRRTFLSHARPTADG